MRGCRSPIGIHITHCGVRAKWVMCAASGCNAEKTCVPVDPVPITATRLPAVSMSVQRAVCTTGPVKRVKAGNVRDERVVQDSGGGDDEVRVDLVSAGGG